MVRMSGTVLPNSESSLNQVVDWKAIEDANEEATKVPSYSVLATVYHLIISMPSFSEQALIIFNLQAS